MSYWESMFGADKITISGPPVKIVCTHIYSRINDVSRRMV